MGDRANIVVVPSYPKRTTTRIYLYGHWSGHAMPSLLQKGLEAGRGRWQDDAYLTRILFQHYLDGNDSTLSFGISITTPDNEHPYLVVDIPKQEVRVEAEGRYGNEGDFRDGMTWPFEEFVSLNINGWSIQ